ncbi:hypothetical protein Fmac_030177 [Flemingia macrophylla]|uniref:Uncharacterized protein n=1 Tax=Flemingia macrophylla TaxID=520843 RepID=A0ABD1LCE7_9FABA
MEDCSNNKRKRVEDHSDSATRQVDSPEFKISRVDSLDPADPVLDSDVRLQDHIFNILDDADNVPERDSVTGLDSVIKSFEDEINAASSGDPTAVSDSGDIQTNLGYLLEASDDELGLPPTVGAAGDPGRVDPDIVNGFGGFEDDFPGYDAYGFGFSAECDGGGGGFVTVDGLFDYAETAADVLWRPESLQAT